MVPEAKEFESRAALGRWLAEHHGTAHELWVRLHKVGTGRASVTWEDCVLAALAVGWIDGIGKSESAGTWLQRLTPRRARSGWSMRNRDHVGRLVAEGAMLPAGLAEVEAAKADGRWDAAYAGPADMVVPEDFLAALEGRPLAKAAYEGLNRQGLYTIYYGLHTAKRPETRARRMEAFLGKLERGERP